MTRLEEIAKVMTEKYKDEVENSKFVTNVFDYQSAWDNEFFINQCKIKNSKQKFYIIDFEPVFVPQLPSFTVGIRLHGRELKHGERTGLFKIKFNDGSIMYAAKWFSGIGKNRVIESMFATESSVWIKFLNLSRNVRRKSSRPKIGTYRIFIDGDGIITYEKMIKIPNNNIYHEELDVIKKSVNYYFDNVESFMKYNQAGRRTILLYGEPGTSKTSTLYKLAAEHKSDKSVVFATDINALASHVKMCEKHNMSTIAFFEDCESALQHNNSDIKNFLSGIHAKQNKGGTCIVYTTNYPEQIESSIKERPERIDELYYIGPISGELLIDCAQFYFDKFSPSRDELKKVLLHPMTGAEVKLFVDNTLKFCASKRIEINSTSMKNVLNKYRDDINKIQKFSEGKLNKPFVKQTPISTFGFNNTNDF